MRKQVKIGKLTRYRDVKWEALAPGREGLGVILEEGIRAYRKIDTKRYFARVTEWSRLTQTVTMSDGSTSTAPMPGADSSDHELLLLALRKEEIVEIQMTGDCQITKFSNGGLKPQRFQQDDEAGSLHHLSSVDDNSVSWTQVSFHSCFLVDKLLWSKPLHPTLPKDRSVSFEQCKAVQVIRCEDLYLVQADLDLLEKTNSGYPLGIDGKERPLAIIWLYRVSVAYNSGQIAPLAEDDRIIMEEHYVLIVNWLKENVPKEVRKGGWTRTAKTIVSIGYNREKRYDEQGLAKYPANALIPKDHLSVPVRYALVLTEWWNEKVEAGKQPRHELACRLVEAGFYEVAAIDLVGMISGQPIPTKDKKAFFATVNKIVKGRAARKRKKPDRVLTLKKGR